VSSGGAHGAVSSPDGTRIAFWRSGRGEPLVLVHGTSADHTRWEKVVPQLAAQFTVFAVDRRGRGESGDAADYAIGREFEDITAVVDAIGGPVTLLGHSYGGMCALEAALRTSAVRRLILYEPPLPTGTEIYVPGLRERMDRLLAAGENEAVLTTFMTEVVRMPVEHVEHFRSLPGWDGRVATAHSVVREIHAHDAYRFEPERWRSFATPTLLLLGSESPPFLAAATEVLRATLPHSTIRLLRGQQHVAMETAPALFVDEILRFAGVGPAAGARGARARRRG
jgi:pimeloyl-ACP methyl ester carboxylesterase